MTDRSGYTMRRDDDGRLRRVRTDLGCEGYYATETTDCSGCTEFGEGGSKHGPFGCHECGYTGKRRTRYFVPFDVGAYAAAMEAESESLLRHYGVTP